MPTDLLDPDLSRTVTLQAQAAPDLIETLGNLLGMGQDAEGLEGTARASVLASSAAGALARAEQGVQGGHAAPSRMHEVLVPDMQAQMDRAPIVALAVWQVAQDLVRQRGDNLPAPTLISMAVAGRYL